MVQTIKIETLTPVHIGSGNFLCNNSDFISLKIGDEPHIVVLSPDKIWQLLGDKGEDFINLWLETIEKKSNIREFIAKFAPNAQSKDYAKRRFLLFSTVRPDDTLKETIHNGMGFPYIPGSSIKGAIRTAILTSSANIVRYKEEKLEKPNTKNIKASKVEQELFGRDPNSDVFRFIQVGDAYFEEESEIATRLINLNIRSSNSDLMDKSKSQLVEAIGQEAESEFQLKISKEYYDFAKSKFRELGELPVSNISDLFNLINVHTKILVEDEIDYWQKIDKSGGEDYAHEIQKILDEINSCGNGKSCILRIGHASGWRFITGAWTEKLTNFKDVVVPASRPNNRNYVEYDFPKTRRLDEESYVLGFVKLTIK
jgi:CRISPR type III-A-associated RAMP protein Csm5